MRIQPERIPFTDYASTIPGLTGHHAAPGHRLEELLDLGRTLHELVGPELERRVLIKKSIKSMHNRGTLGSA